MYKRLAVLFLSMMLLSGCQKSAGITGENTTDSAAEALVLEERKDCPLDELFSYLEEESAKASYAYAQILITTDALDEEEIKKFQEDSDYKYRHDIVKMKGTADISWQTFQTEEEFQEYFSMREKEDSVLSKDEESYTIELTYCKYPLAKDTHILDIYHYLKEHYDEEENQLYAATINNELPQDCYCFSQPAVWEIVVMDNIFYGLKCKATDADRIKTEDISGLLLAYSTQKQEIELCFGWVMSEETLYWIDHDERYSTLENPTRSFHEVRASDTMWEETGTRYMGNFAMLKEADYQIAVCENGPMLQLHFQFMNNIPEGGYVTYLYNGDCTNRNYEMTVTNLDTDKLMQSQTVKMSIEMPDMITFTDLDEDGYLDMRIVQPTHWNGERAVVDEYSGEFLMFWNPRKEAFEVKSRQEGSEIRAQNRNQYLQEEETDFIEYVVQSGDTLWGISRRFYGTGTLYTKIESENAEVLYGYKYLMPKMVLKISMED